MITIHSLPFTANGSLITPITFTHSLRSRELWPLSSGADVGLRRPKQGITTLTLGRKHVKSAEDPPQDDKDCQYYCHYHAKGGGVAVQLGSSIAWIYEKEKSIA